MAHDPDICQSCGGTGADPNPLNDPGPCPECGTRNSATAIIENGSIVIRVPISCLPVIVEGGWAAGGYDTRFRVTDAPLFAGELCNALNDEEEDGTTPIHKMFDACIIAAADQGAEGIEEHPEQEA